ncbi:MAG: DUF4367 domain-containing protein [Clostridia bacterium]|nr:DUF4367 domain-containing protein [Clostridia bacterium]
MNNLTIACEMSLNKWSDTFPDIIPEAECSKKHEKWKRNLFNKMRNDRYHRFTTKAIKVMLVAAVLFALLLTAFVIPSSREFMLDKFDEYSTYKLTENNKNSVAGEIKVGYVPEGYDLTEKLKSNKQILNIYNSYNGKVITILKYSSIIKVEFDTENFISEEKIIDGVKYVYCKGNEDVNNLIWTTNDYIYRISGTLTLEELLKIAKTVE